MINTSENKTQQEQKQPKKVRFDDEIISKLNEVKEPEIINPEITIINPEITIKNIKIIKYIKFFLINSKTFNELVNKAKLTIEPKQYGLIKNIINYLVEVNNKKRPIDNIIKETLIIYENKVELHDIPKLINVIYECIININDLIISSNDICILIKLIIFVLIDTETIDIINNDYEVINQVIDSSIVLLSKSIEIKVPKNKCVCF
jgi:hypothetical protein